MIWVVLFIIVIVLILMGASSENKTNEDYFQKTSGYKSSELIYSGTYVSGHPNLNNSFDNVYLLQKPDKVQIYTLQPAGYILKAEISKVDIKNVAMEDASTVQNRVTVGRLLLTGVFAFAWKKKTKQECAYFIIEWNYGSFENETIFELEGKGSIQKANTIRNRFIAYLTNSTSKLNDEIFDNRLKEVINADLKLAAIRLCHDEKGMSIIEAKAYIENLKNNDLPNFSTDDEKYIDLIKKNRKAEAVNLFIYNNKSKLEEAQTYIEKLEITIKS